MQLDISEIKVMRKRFGLTQSELAKNAGVSQSLIAKIEAAKIDPAYSKASKIFVFLNSMREKQELKASHVMRPSVISVNPGEAIADVIAKMRKHNISQLPVVSENKCIGLVSEATILNSLLGRKAKTAGEIMEDAPPVVSRNTSINVVSELLRHVPIVMIAEKGKLQGVITKSDILGKLKNL